MTKTLIDCKAELVRVQGEDREEFSDLVDTQGWLVIGPESWFGDELRLSPKTRGVTIKDKTVTVKTTLGNTFTFITL